MLLPAVALATIVQMVSVVTDAETFVATLTAMVKEDRGPTADELAAIGMREDDMEAIMQAIANPSGVATPVASATALVA